MRLVIDTNRIMAGLLKESASRKIILHRSFTFFAPDYLSIELSKHRSYLMKKAKIAEREYDLLMNTLLERIVLVPFEDFECEYRHAIQVMGEVDENDAPFLAVGLALDIGHIWTEDRHFLKQDFLRVCTTRDLIGLI